VADGAGGAEVQAQESGDSAGVAGPAGVPSLARILHEIGRPVWCTLPEDRKTVRGYELRLAEFI